MYTINKYMLWHINLIRAIDLTERALQLNTRELSHSPDYYSKSLAYPVPVTVTVPYPFLRPHLRPTTTTSSNVDANLGFKLSAAIHFKLRHPVTVLGIQDNSRVLEPLRIVFVFNHSSWLKIIDFLLMYHVAIVLKRHIVITRQQDAAGTFFQHRSVFSTMIRLHAENIL